MNRTPGRIARLYSGSIDNAANYPLMQTAEDPQKNKYVVEPLREAWPCANACDFASVLEGCRGEGKLQGQLAFSSGGPKIACPCLVSVPGPAIASSIE